MSLYDFEHEKHAEGYKYICGVDEAGKGPLAGPVFAAAVILPEDYEIEGIHDSKKLSEKGATGLMQIMPKTANYVSREFFGGREIDLTLPKDNIETGCFYLSYLREKFKNETETLAAYNAGEGNVKIWKNERGGKLSENDIPFPETKKYVRRVKAYAKIYRFILNFKGVILNRFIMQ